MLLSSIIVEYYVIGVGVEWCGLGFNGRQSDATLNIPATRHLAAHRPFAASRAVASVLARKYPYSENGLFFCMNGEKR